MQKIDFQDEINLLSESQNITDKLTLFSLYQDLYLILISTVEEMDTELAQKYSKILTEMFKMHLILTKNVKKDINAKIIMKLYLKKISQFQFSNVSPLKEMISIYQENLDEMFEKFDFINLIENSNYDFFF